jgi:hypothetical protein
LTLEDFFKLLAAATLAATFTLIVTWVKAARDDLRADANYFVSILMMAADLASSYWLKPGSDPDAILEGVRLLGLQQRLSRLRLSTFSSFHDVDRSGLDEDLVDFFDACSGGRHGDKNRPIDTNRAREAQAVAARIDAHIRTSLQRSSTLKAYLGRTLRLGQ